MPTSKHHKQKTKSKTIKYKNNKNSKRVSKNKRNKEYNIKKLINRGGVMLADGVQDRRTALLYFINNSKFKILTNSSLTCITLLARLNPGINTPFITARSNNFIAPVNQILLKISITNNAAPQGGVLLPIPGRAYDGIQLMTEAEMVQEVNIQKRIYRKTFLERVYNSPFDGICPAIIETAMHIPKDDTMRLGRIFIDNLEARNGRALLDDKQELIKILNYTDLQYPDNNISMIVMEFMDGYSTYYDAGVAGRLIPAHFHMVNYVFKQLHELGYIHNDAHMNNIMINTDEPFFTSSARPDALGRVIIIDFGRATPITPAQRALSEHDRLNLERFYTERFWDLYKYQQITNDMLILGRLRVLNRIFTPIIAVYMRTLGLPLPHNPYSLLNNIIGRNIINRAVLQGGLNPKINKKLELKGNYDEGYNLDTSYYDEVKNQLKTMSLDKLKSIVFSQLDKDS